jgi:transposase
MKNHHSFNDSVILGVDTHLNIHVGAVLSYDGKLLGTKVIQTNQVGYEELFGWVLTFGSVERAGIEGTGTYGAGLTRFLIKKGLDVIEINRPDRSKRRLEGKSDPLDAENAARTVLSGSAKAVPKLQSGACEALRIISVARRSAVKAKSLINARPGREQKGICSPACIVIDTVCPNASSNPSTAITTCDPAARQLYLLRQRRQKE